MVIKRTNEEFVEMVGERFPGEFTILSEYRGSRHKVKVKHNKCGGIKSIEPRILLNTGRACNDCSKKNRIKKVSKTHEEFKKEVYGLVGDEYTVEGTYIKSHVKVRLRHNKCGRVYNVLPNSFTSTGNRCPCRGMSKYNFKPQKVDGAKNISMDVEGYEILEDVKGNHEEVKIQHKICGGVFYKTPYAFMMRKSRCPNCETFTNEYNRKKADERFKSEMKRVYGDEYTILSGYTNAKTKVNIRHNSEECGNYEYGVLPNNTLRGSKCPECFGTPKKTTEEYKRQVKELVGEEYVVLNEYKTNKDKIEFLHKICNETYQVPAGLFLRGRRCPNCKESEGESKIREYLVRNKIKFKKEYRIDYPNGGYGRVDFVLLDDKGEVKQGIEFDGMHHFKPVKYYGDNSEERFEYVKYKDKQKNDYFKENNIPLIRIPYWEYSKIDKVLKEKIS